MENENKQTALENWQTVGIGVKDIKRLEPNPCKVLGVGKVSLNNKKRPGEIIEKIVFRCQHPERECQGACEQKPRVPSWQPMDPTQPVQGFTVETFGRDNFVTCLLVAALSGATLGILYGAGRWVIGVLA